VPAASAVEFRPAGPAGHASVFRVSSICFGCPRCGLRRTLTGVGMAYVAGKTFRTIKIGTFVGLRLGRAVQRCLATVGAQACGTVGRQGFLLGVRGTVRGHPGDGGRARCPVGFARPVETTREKTIEIPVRIVSRGGPGARAFRRDLSAFRWRTACGQLPCGPSGQLHGATCPSTWRAMGARNLRLQPVRMAGRRLGATPSFPKARRSRFRSVARGKAPRACPDAAWESLDLVRRGVAVEEIHD